MTVSTINIFPGIIITSNNENITLFFTMCFSFQFLERPHVPKNVLLEVNEENEELTCEVVKHG